MSDNTVEKGLEQFDKELNQFLSIKQKLDGCKIEDRKLEIRLAQLQTDVQTYLAISLALFAAMAALIVIVATNPLSYNGFIVTVVIIILGFLAIQSVLKAQRYRNMMNTL